MSTPILEVSDLVAHYGETLILDRVSCVVNPGEIFVIVGGSGCAPRRGFFGCGLTTILAVAEEEAAASVTVASAVLAVLLLLFLFLVVV